MKGDLKHRLFNIGKKLTSGCEDNVTPVNLRKKERLIVKFSIYREAILFDSRFSGQLTLDDTFEKGK